MGVGEIRKSLQDDAEERYNLERCEVKNFGKEFYELSFVRRKTSDARVRETL